MKYVIPQTITLTTSNVAEETLPEWNVSSVYNTHDEVKVSADKKKYKYAGLDGTNTATAPSLNKTSWVSAPLNPYAMIDGTMSTQTTNADSIDIVFDATNIDDISFFNLDATEITISMVDKTTLTTIFNETYSLVYDELADFGDYLFSEQELRDKLTGNVSNATLDLVIAGMSEQDVLDRFTANPPIYYNSTVTISIKKIGSIAKCGYLVIGRQRDLGITLWGGSMGIQSFSLKNRNAWGEVELQKRDSADTMDMPVILDNTTVDVVKNRLKKIDGIPCVFIGDESDKFTSLTIYGFFKDFDIGVNPTKSTYTLSVESMI